MHKRNKKTKKINKRRKYVKHGGQDPFESDIAPIGMEESFTLEDNPLDIVAEEEIDPLNNSFGSQGSLALDDLNITNENNNISDANNSLGLDNWENPDYSGNTTFESFLSEPSMEIGGKKKTKKRNKKQNNKTKKIRKSKKIKKVKKTRKTRKSNKRRIGGATDMEDTSPPAYNESYDELTN